MNNYSFDILNTNISCNEYIHNNFKIIKNLSLQIDNPWDDYIWEFYNTRLIELLIIVKNNLNKIIGYIIVWSENPQNDYNQIDISSCYYIADVIIDKNYRKQGLGTQMFKILFKHTKGFKIILDSDANEFYIKLGFKSLEENSFYFNN